MVAKLRTPRGGALNVGLMRLLRPAVPFLLLLLALVRPLAAATPDEVAAWSAALDAAEAAIRKNHPEPFRRTPEATFAAEFAALKARLPALSWPEFVAGLRRCVGLVQDGHTGFYGTPDGTPGFTQRYPVRFYSFADGLFVTRAAAGYEALLGGRVTRLNGRPVADVIAAFAPLMSGESPQWQLNWVPGNLTYPGFHTGLGLAGPRGESHLLVEVERPGGDAVELAVAAVPAAENPPLRTALEHLGSNAQPPLFMTEERNIVLFPRPEHRAVHVLFQSVGNEPVKLAAFAAELEQALAADGVDKVIFDLRGNGGGNNTLLQPLVHAVIRTPKVNRPGGVLVLTSRATFSAAQNFCTFLERETQAMFVGEATGLGPNHFGDATPHELGATGLTLYVSTLRWWDGNPKDPRRYTDADLPAAQSFADYLAGRDTVLEAALTYRAPADAPVYPPIYRWRRDTQKPAVAAGRN